MTTGPNRTLLSGKSVLVTGGTGSFGHSMARQLAALNPGQVRIFSRDEDKQVRMKRELPDFQYVLGDIRDKDRVLLATRGVDVVFHAAALKQVPHCELHPYEAFQTNAMGSHHLAEAAIQNGVEIVIGLSTDKAVKPVNAMGISKAMMEKLFCSRNEQQVDTRFCCTRYGNIMGSRGSVIPLFVAQIEAGKDLTLTHPDMTRFLMDIGESVDLVLFALQHAKGGELFVMKSPACRMEDLAKAVLQAHGDPVAIRTTGVRPGEKLHEVLVNEYELQRCVEDDRFFTILPEYRRAPPSQHPAGAEYTSATTRQITDVAALTELLSRAGVLDRAHAHARSSSQEGRPYP